MRKPLFAILLVAGLTSAVLGLYFVSEFVLRELQIGSHPIVVIDQVIENGVQVRIQAEPAEHSWAFCYEVKQNDKEIVPWTFFGTGRRKHVSATAFRLDKLEGSQIYYLYEVTDPNRLFLIVDCTTLKAQTVSILRENDKRLLEKVKSRTNCVRYTIDNFQGTL